LKALLINIMTLILCKIMYQSIISGREDNVLPVASAPFWSLTQAEPLESEITVSWVRSLSCPIPAIV
jgi:hypothetical protein